MAITARAHTLREKEDILMQYKKHKLIRFVNFYMPYVVIFPAAFPKQQQQLQYKMCNVTSLLRLARDFIFPVCLPYFIQCGGAGVYIE